MKSIPIFKYLNDGKAYEWQHRICTQKHALPSHSNSQRKITEVWNLNISGSQIWQIRNAEKLQCYARFNQMHTKQKKEKRNSQMNQNKKIYWDKLNPFNPNKTEILPKTKEQVFKIWRKKFRTLICKRWEERSELLIFLSISKKKTQKFITD